MIYRRIPDGWSPKVPNTRPEHCDLDGAKLWVDPGGQIYCDSMHDELATRNEELDHNTEPTS